MRLFFFLLLFSPVLIAEPVRVITSVLPLKTFVEKIGGNHVDVKSLVRPGYNPHTYDLSPRQIMAVSKAHMFVRTGVPFEDAWMERIRSANTKMLVIDVRDGMDLLELAMPEELPEEVQKDHDGHSHHHTHKHTHHAGEIDPHIWTDPIRVKQLADNILKALVKIDAENEKTYRANHAEFIQQINLLDKEIRQYLAEVKNRKFLVFHPAWGYFANQYGLEQVAIEFQGKEPGAKTIAGVISLAREDGIRVIFVQPQFDQRLAKKVADAIEGRVIVVDPLSADYIENMLTVASQFGRVLQ